MIISAITTAHHIATLSAAIVDNAKSGVKLSKVMRDICAVPANLTTADDLNEFHHELSAILTSARAQSEAQAEDYISAYLSKRDAQSIPAFRKSVTNAWTYARKIAGETAGCEFTYSKNDKTFSVAVKKAANEPTKKPASGRESGVNTDIHAANQAAADTISIELPELPLDSDKSKQAKQAKAARIQAAKKAVRGLIVHGFTTTELAIAFEEIMASHAAGEAAKAAGQLDSELAKVVNH